MKAATCCPIRICAIGAISIHAAREGGDAQRNPRWLMFTISIHAAREGGDLDAVLQLVMGVVISIHAAREGGDNGEKIYFNQISDFNPRRP